MRNIARQVTLIGFVLYASMGVGIMGAALTSNACAAVKPPASLTTPAGVQAWYGTRVVKALDELRDFTIAANSVTPPMVSTGTTRQVVLYHQSAVRIIESTPSGWRNLVQSGLIEVMNNLPADERTTLLPYIELAKALIERVH